MTRTGTHPNNRRDYATLRLLALGAAWLLLWRVSALMEFAPHASIWFPPAGLTFAAYLVMGLRVTPVILVCSVVATFWADAMYATPRDWQQALVGGLMFGVAHCLSYGTGALVLRRLVQRGRSDVLPALIIAFLVLAALAALAAALTGTLALELSGSIDASVATSLWLPWWIGDMAGVIVLGPLLAGLLAWREPTVPEWIRELDLTRPGHPGHGWLLKALVLAVPLTVIMLLAARFEDAELLSFAVFFLIIPQMWITHTESALRTALSLALFCTLTAVLVSALGLIEQAMVYQFAITVIAASTYFGLAVPVLVDHNRELRVLTDTDELTGVTSRRSFFAHGRTRLSRARLANAPVALILFDIDRFKQVNDSLGHVAGDRILVEVASAVRAALRQSDLLGRFGGDEFMLLMTECEIEPARQMAERVRAILPAVNVSGIDVRITGSVSVVRVTERESLMDAFERADGLLLKAKRNGRNRVESEQTTES